ncbi:hypothetical protein CRUP_011123, partial [Coryphaenoides rupestris]
YTSSRPSSAETAHLGSRSNSVSSHTRPERDLRPLSLRYSTPQRSSHYQAPAEGPAMPPPPQVHSAAYSGLHRASRLEKAPLIKSNSWSTPQSSLSYALSSAQRHSDLCPARQPLSPLYDEPCTPDLYAREPRLPAHHAQSSWQGSVQSAGHLQQTPAPLPNPFQLCTPPLGKRCRRSLVLTNPQGHALGLELEPAPATRPPGPGPTAPGLQQRAEAVSRLKLLTAPCPPVHEQRLIPSSPLANPSQMPYCYSPDYNSYLQPTEPDDQEMDYDNIWEYDYNTGMIQPMSGISPHRTGLDFGARGLSAMGNAAEIAIKQNNEPTL